MKYLLIALFLISCGQEKDDSDSNQTDKYTGKYLLDFSQVFNFTEITVSSFLLTEGSCILIIGKSEGKYNIIQNNECTLVNVSTKEEIKISHKSEEKGLSWYEGKENTAIPLPANSNIIPIDNSEDPGLKFDNVTIQFEEDGLISKISDKEGNITKNFYKKDSLAQE